MHVYFRKGRNHREFEVEEDTAYLIHLNWQGTLLSEQGVVNSTKAKACFHGYQTQIRELTSPKGPARSC